MNNKHNLILDILNKIDPDILELGTKQRIKLIQKMQNARLHLKRTVAMVSAAAIIMVVTVVALFQFLHNQDPIGAVLQEKQIPIYEGMSVSKEKGSPNQQLKETPHLQPLSLASKSTLSSLTKEQSTESDMYYVEQNEDFYITVHIHNPDNFEIISFTLNGEKYTSYMFESGSDMENIIIKCNAGAEVGTLEYELDAVKYIDETEIKNALMHGERIVRVGVYNPNHPKADASITSVLCGSAELGISLSDPAKFLDDAQTVALIYENDSFFKTYPISQDTASLELTDLQDDAAYRVDIVAVYDAMDGKGTVDRVIGSISFRTPSLFTLQIDNVLETTVDFLIETNFTDTPYTFQSLSLYQGTNKVRDIDSSTHHIEGLYSGVGYSLRLTYTLGVRTITKEVKFTTVNTPIPASSLPM